MLTSPLWENSMIGIQANNAAKLILKRNSLISKLSYQLSLLLLKTESPLMMKAIETATIRLTVGSFGLISTIDTTTIILYRIQSQNSFSVIKPQGNKPVVNMISIRRKRRSPFYCSYCKNAYCINQRIY